ncbi:HNH endonuclease signature motif containing protein [Plantibacter sp. CFBP 13570]|uniref:HNH endonuclease signature motif containing protein n=1 Tax=Plantibacter sp. CFBP 13570 TaxID=2775272 RepID=UPI001FD4844D|nr:HNH endonuclease signature motif containing protein [Plantibacter sp. CFBP 13570]
MTETITTAIRASDEHAARLAEFSDHYADIQRRRAALDAEEARLLARSAAYADALADSVVPAVFPPAERLALSRRSTCAALAMATRTPERTVQRATNTVPALSMAGVSDVPGMLDGYGPIDPQTAARIAVNAPGFTRIIVQPETGAVLSVGRNQYRVPADLQRAVRLRDGTCRAPGCGRRVRACDLDHSVAWDDGGTTDVGNLACLCRHHHRMKHLPGWNLDHQPGGVLEWTTPDGKHHRTEPDPAPF